MYMHYDDGVLMFIIVITLNTICIWQPLLQPQAKSTSMKTTSCCFKTPSCTCQFLVTHFFCTPPPKKLRHSIVSLWILRLLMFTSKLVSWCKHAVKQSVSTGAMETVGVAGNFDPCVKLVADVWFLVLTSLQQFTLWPEHVICCCLSWKRHVGLTDPLWGSGPTNSCCHYLERTHTECLCHTQPAQAHTSQERGCKLVEKVCILTNFYFHALLQKYGRPLGIIVKNACSDKFLRSLRKKDPPPPKKIQRK